jgi:hypothetical protein
MLGKGVQSGIELGFAGRPVVTRDEPAIIVEQYLFGDRAEVSERALDTGDVELGAVSTKRSEEGRNYLLVSSTIPVWRSRSTWWRRAIATGSFSSRRATGASRKAHVV